MAVLTGFLFSLGLIIYFIEQDYNLFASRQIQNNSVASIKNVVVLPEPGRVNSELLIGANNLPTEERVNLGLPVRLRIPKINVDAFVEYVGLTSQGEVGIPKDPANAAWFDLGPRPGENGNSIIVGHYGWNNNIPAVFDNLYKLKSGDKIYIEDEKGAIITFIVRESRRYDPGADVSYVFNSNDGGGRLNLITCEGIWNKVSKSYSKRLVVFTDKVVE